MQDIWLKEQFTDVGTSQRQEAGESIFSDHGPNIPVAFRVLYKNFGAGIVRKNTCERPIIGYP